MEKENEVFESPKSISVAETAETTGLSGAWDPVTKTWDKNHPGLTPIAPKKVKHKSRPAAQRAYRQREKEAKKVEAGSRWNSPYALSEKEVRSVLKAERGITTSNVLNQCYLEGIRLASDLGIVANRMYWISGPEWALACKAADTALPAPEVMTGPGGRSEILKRNELKALYDFTNGGQLAVNGQVLSFHAWLDWRDRFRKDLFWATSEILKHPLDEHFHRPMVEFFPKLNFDDCYPDNYTLKHVHDAIDKQEPEYKERVLLDQRGGWKSTVHGCFVVQLLCNAPDCRCFILSASDDTALGFLRDIKAKFALAEDEPLSDFHLLFPDYIVRGVDGYSEQPFIVPARKHKQKDWSLWTDGALTTLNSKHCDYLGLDDPCEPKNSSNEETRAKLKAKLDNIANLLDPWGLRTQIGTRFSLGDAHEDRLNLADEGVPIKVFVRPAWVVKEPFLNVPLRDLTLEMVDLAWPTRLGTPERTFADLRKHLLANEVEFRTQKLNEPVGDDAALKITFTEDNLKSHTHDIGDLPQDGPIYCSVDQAHSVSRYADFSCLMVARITKNARNESSIDIIDCLMERLRSSELAVKIVMMAQKWPLLKDISIEKSGDWELLGDEIKRQAALRGILMPHISWKDVDNSKGSKFERLKKVEILLSADRLWFLKAAWNEVVFEQFVRCDGKRSTNQKKDDAPDCCSRLMHYCPGALTGNPEEEECQRKEQQEKEKQEDMSAMIFGGPSKWHVSSRSDWGSTPTDPLPEEESNGRGLFGIPGLRGFGASKPTDKFHGFGDLRKKQN